MDHNQFFPKICNLIDLDYSGDQLRVETDIGNFQLAVLEKSADIIAINCLKLKGKTIEIWVGDGSETRGFFNRIEEHVAEVELPPLPYGKIFETQTSQKIFGPPGTGKTTKLIGLVEEAIKSGVSPNDIAFISFSNGAANVAKKRVSEALPEFGSIDFPNFSTMHSLATRVGEDTGKTLMEEKHFKAFDPKIDTWKEWTELGNPLGLVERYRHPILDRLSNSISRCAPMDCRNLLNPLSPAFTQKAYDLLGHVLKADERSFKMKALENKLTEGFCDNLIHQYVECFHAYKRENNLINFDDVITRVSSETFSDELIPTFDLLIIDEAQDLTANLWKFAKKLIGKSKEAYIAGDDDQAIMIGIGASPETFVNLKTTEADNPLENSHRIPKAARDYVDRGVMPILEKLPNRSGVTWVPNKKSGFVNSGFRGVIKDGDGEKRSFREEFSPKELVRKIKQDFVRTASDALEIEKAFYAEEGLAYLNKLLFNNQIYLNEGDHIFNLAAQNLADNDLNKMFENVGRGVLSPDQVFSSAGIELLYKIEKVELKDEAPPLIPDWLVMAPTKQTGSRISNSLRELGVPHFYRNQPVLDAQVTRTKIRVQTVHMSKGDEAYNTAVVVESRWDIKMLVDDPRLAYVALTRSQNRTFPRVIKEELLGDMRSDGYGDLAKKYQEMFPIG